MEQAIIFYRTSIFQVTKKIAHHENMVRYIVLSESSLQQTPEAVFKTA